MLDKKEIACWRKTVEKFGLDSSQMISGKMLMKFIETIEQLSVPAETLVMPKIAEGKRKFTEEEEKYIWWGVQWAFKPENKNRIFKQNEFFDYVYYEMEV